MKNIFIFFTLLLSTICFGQDSYTYSQPKEINDGWNTNSLKAQNVDTTLIYKMFSHLKSKENKLHSVLLIKNNELIIEEYFKEYSADKQHDLRSVTKSIRAILMGIAIDKGLINSEKELNSPVQIVAELCIGVKKEKVKLFVLSYLGSDTHCVVTANANYKLIEFQVGSGYVDALRTLSTLKPHRSEIVVGDVLPCHYAISEEGSINAVFSSRRGIMRSSKGEAQMSYLKSFSWPDSSRQE